MAGQPIDSRELNRTIQHAVESSYSRAFSHIDNIYKRLGSLERTEHAYLVFVDSLAQLPPTHNGGLAFVKDEESWYYCNGTSWLQVEGGGGGPGGMEVHVLATNTGLGTYHTMSGATIGDVLRATGNATARFMQLSHDDLGDVTADQHHAKLHNITDPNHHQISAADWGVVGAVGANALGIRNPSANVTGATKEALLKSDTSGYLTLVRSIASDRMQTPRIESASGDLLVTAANDVVVSPPHWTVFADNKDMRSQSHISGFLGQGWRISWPEVDKPHLDIRSIYAEQLEVTAFQADIMRVRIAEDFLTQGMAFTALTFTTPHTIGGTVDVTFEDNPVLGNAQLFLPNEWVLFNIIQRGAGLIVAQIWGQVSDYVDLLPDANGVERQTWTFTLRNGRTDFVIPKNSLALAFGVSGQKNGYIHHNVLSTAYGPWTRYATWTGSDPYTVANRRYHVQVGNLHGLVDIDTDRYGIAAGDNLAKTPNDPTTPFKGFTADNVGGMRMFNTDISAYVGAVQKMYIAASGQEMWLGTSSSDKRFSYLNGDLTVIGTLEAGGGKFRANDEGVKLRVNPGSMFEAEDERIEWLYNSLDTNLRTWIGTRVYGTSDGDSQLALAAVGGIAGAWGSIALRAREHGQSTLLDTEGATLLVTPKNVWVGPQAGMRISTNPSDISTPVPGGQLYVEQIYVEDLTVTGTLSGESMSGASWAYPGDMLINAAASTNTVVSVGNLGAGRADLSVDRDIIVGGTVDGVDVSALSSSFNVHVGNYDTHVANVNAHHNQVHGINGSDHTGTLSWTKVNKTGSSLADLTTRLYGDLTSRTHVLATNAALGPDHSISGATAGHVLRASSATTARFAQLQHNDLGGVTADQHHNQVHNILGGDHTIVASQYQIVGIPTTSDVLGLITPASTGNNVILKTDGTGGISLTNLTVANVILANGGVDYGVDTLIEDATYLQLAGTKPLNTAVALQAASWSLTTAGAFIAVSLSAATATLTTKVTTPLIDAPGNLTLAPASDLIFDPVSNNAVVAADVWLKSANYASETTGWAISPLGYLDTRGIHADEIIAKSFIVDLEQALAGGEIVTKSVTTLALPFTAPHATTTTIAFRAKSTATAATASHVITKPAGTVEFDLLLAHIVTAMSVSVTTPPAGWTLLVAHDSATTRVHVYYKVAGAAEGADYTWALSLSGEVIGTIQAFSGVNAASPIHTYSVQSGSGTAMALPSVTAGVNGTGLVWLAGVYDTATAGTTLTPPAGFNEREDALGAVATWIGAANTIQAGLGASGDITGTLSLAHAWAGVLVDLTPATWTTVKLTVDDLPSAAGMAVFETGDIVLLRSFSRAGGGLTIANCWGVVSAYVGNGDGTQTWTFARSASPNSGSLSAGAIIAARAIVLDFGTDGDGYYEINAYSGTYGSTAPYSQVVKWTGHPATGSVVRTREGNLEGITAQANEYGLWAGAKGASPIGAADQYIRVSNLGVLINNVPIKLYNAGGVQTIQLNSDGTAWFKDAAGNYKMNWDGTNLAIAGSLTVTGGSIGGGGDNLLLNSSFETDTNGDGTADQWASYNNSGGAQPVTLTLVAGRNGGYAQRVAWSITNTTTKGLTTASQNTTAGGRKAGVSYVVSWWAYQTLNIPCSMELRYNIQPNEFEWLLNPTAANGVWQRWAARVKWTANNTDNLFITVLNGAACTGSIDFDDVMVQEGETLTNYQPRAAEILPGTITGDMVQITSYLAIGTGNDFGVSDGIQLQYNGGNPRAYIGNGSNRYFKFDGTTISWQAANTSLDTSGNLTATNATLSGNVTAAAGTIGGWTLGATSLTSGSGTSTRGIDSGGSNPAFYAGSATPGSAPFRVTPAGVLNATGAVINGQITATSGSITGTLTMGASGKIDMTTVDLDANGITAVAGSTWTMNNGYSFSFGGTKAGGLFGRNSATYNYVALNANTLDGFTAIDSKFGEVNISAVSGANYIAQIQLGAISPGITSTPGSPFAYATATMYLETDTVGMGGTLITMWADRVKIRTNDVWHSGNLIISNYAALSGATFTGVVQTTKLKLSAYKILSDAVVNFQTLNEGAWQYVASRGITLNDGTLYTSQAGGFELLDGSGNRHRANVGALTINPSSGSWSGGIYSAANADGYGYFNYYYGANRSGYMIWYADRISLVSDNNCNIVLGPGGTGKVGINNVSPSYMLDVSGEGRITGTWRSDIAVSLKVQASSPAPSTIYGVLYVDAGGSLRFIHPNGTTPGDKISA